MFPIFIRIENLQAVNIQQSHDEIIYINERDSESKYFINLNLEFTEILISTFMFPVNVRKTINTEEMEEYSFILAFIS